MMETKELFDWVLKQPCFEVFDFLYVIGKNLNETLEVGHLQIFGSLTQKTSFMLFLNKFDIFEKKVLDVRAEAYFFV